MKITVTADNLQLAYMGRIGYEDKQRPEFYFPGTNVTLRFKGTQVSVKLNDHRCWGNVSMGYVLDGREGKFDIEKHYEDTTILIADNLENEEHELTVFKRQDSTHYVEFLGFELNEDAEILEKKKLPSRKIEAYGDSVTAGAVCEAVDYVGKNDPENHDSIYDNAWHSYALITARNLGAQIHDIAQGGIAILDGTGYYHAPDYIGMESVYDKCCFMPEGKNGQTPWDFSQYIPDVVTFAVGQNDQHYEGHEDFNIEDREYRESWKESYKKIIRDLRAKYPKAYIVLLLTVLNHDKGWDDALEEIKNELCDERISHLKFTRSGKATPGHPRLPEHYEMAEELTAYLSNMGDKIWEK